MDALILRTLYTGDVSDIEAKERYADQLIQNFLTKKRPAVQLQMEVALSGSGGGTGGSRGSYAGNPERIAAALAAKLEHDWRLSQQRQASISAEGAARVSQIEQQAAARREAQQQAHAARLEQIEHAHQQRLAQMADAAAQRQAQQQANKGNRWEDMQRSGYYNLAAGAALTSTFTAPMAALGIGATRFGADFQEEMQHVITLTDVGRQELQGLKEDVLALSRDEKIRQGPAALADGLYYVTSTGRKGVDGMEALKASALAASAGLGETAVVANTVTTVLDAYGLKTSQAIKVTDALTQAVKFGKGEANEYASAFPKVIAIAAQAGVSFEEVAAQLASATRMGLTPNESATALRQIFNNLIDPSEKAQRAMKDMGTSVQELRQMLRGEGLFNTLKDLSQRSGGDIGGITELFGNIRALTGFLSTTGTHTLDEYKKTLDAIRNSSGATEKAAAVASETLSFQLEKLKNEVAALGIELTSDALPKLIEFARGMREEMPAAIHAMVQAWDELPAPVQKALAALLGALALAGPMKMVAGNVLILTSTLGGLIKLVSGSGAGVLRFLDALKLAVPALGAAGGGAALTGLAASAGGMAVGLSALAVAAEVAAIAYYNMEARIKDVDVAQHNAASSADSLQRALATAQKYAGGSSSSKSALAQLAEDAAAAGNDTGKMMEVIKKAAALKIEIGKDMKLSETGKALAKNDLQRFINQLSSQVIEIDVRLKGAVVEAQSAGQTGQLTWEERARRAGVFWPKEPTTQPATGIPGFFGSQNEPTQADKDVYERLRAAAIRQTEEYERRNHLSTEATAQTQAATQATQQHTQAITSQTKAIADLTDKELLRERARLEKLAADGKLTIGSPDEQRARQVEAESQVRAARIQADWERTKAMREQAAADEARRLREIAEETADRLREIEEKRLQQRLQMWQQFGNSVEAIVGGIQRAGDDGDHTRQLAAQAQMARREFAGIDPELRRIVIGIAAIGDQMDRLTKTRDNLRSLFGDLFKDALRNGGDVKAIMASADYFEKRLDYTRKMVRLDQQMKRAAHNVIDESEIKREQLSARIEQLNEAGRKRGQSYTADAYVSGTSSSGAVSIDALRRAIIGKESGGKYTSVNSDSGALGLGQVMPSNVGPWTKAALGKALSQNEFLNNPAAQLATINHRLGIYLDEEMKTAKGDVSTAIRRVAARWYSGDADLYNSKKPQGKYPTIEAYTLDILARVNSGAAPSGPPEVSPMPIIVGQDGKPVLPAGTNVAERVEQTPTLPAARKRRPYNAPPSPDFDGDLLTQALPRGWGGAVSQYGMKPGESREWQLRIQDMILNRKEFEKAAKDANMTVDQYAAVMRRIAKRQDSNNAIAAVHDQTAQAIRTMGREIRMLGKSDNPYLILLEEFNTGADRLLSQHGKDSKAKMTLGLMVEQTRQATREMRRDVSAELGNRNSVRPLLDSPDFNEADYERRSFADQQRREIWNSGDIRNLYQAAQALREEGKVLEANAKLREANRQAAERLALAMMRYDSQQAESALRNYAVQQRTSRDALAMINYEADLIAGGMNRADAAAAAEREAARRETARGLESGVATQDATGTASGGLYGNGRTGKGGGYLAQLAAGKFSDAAAAGMANKAGEDVGAQQAASGRRALLGDAAELQAQHDLEMNMLDIQRQRIGLYKAEDPELQIQLQMLEREHQLRSANLQIDKDKRLSEADIKARVDKYGEEIRAQSEINRLQQSRYNANQAELDLLSLQKEAELAMAFTAAERLAIEQRYNDELNRRRGIDVSPEELATRGSILGQTAANERQQEIISLGQEVHRSLSDGVYNGMKEGFDGVASSVLQNFADQVFRELAETSTAGLTNKLFGRKVVQQRDPFAGLLGGGENDLPQTPPFNPNPNAVPSLSGELQRWRTSGERFPGIPQTSLLGKAAKAVGGERVNHVTLHANVVRADIETATLNARNLNGSSGNGSASGPSGDQLWSNIFDVGSIFT